MQSFKKLWFIFDDKDRLFFFFILFLFLIQAFLEIISIASVIPFVTALLSPSTLENFKYFKTLKTLIPFNDINSLLPIFSLAFFLFFLIKSFSLIIIYKIIFKYIFNLKKKIVIKLLKKYLNQNYNFFIQNPYSKLLTNINVEVQNFIINYIRASLILLSESVILLSIVFLVILSGYIKTFLFFTPIFIVTFLIIKKLNKNIKKWSNEKVINERAANNSFFQIILGIKEIILTGKVGEVINRFHSYNKKLVEIQFKQSFVQTFPRPILEIFAISAFLLTLVYFYYQGIPSQEIIVILSFYLAIAYRMLPSLNKIFVHYQQIKFGKVSLSIVFNDLKLNDKLVYLENDANKLNFNKNIELKNISFKFDDRKILIENLNFKIQRNNIIGIYGDSGSGKSTLLNIICLLIKPEFGEILIDSNKISDDTQIRKYQNLISFVSQDTFLLDDTIKNNILFGNDKNLDEKKMNEALKFSQVENFVKDFPKGIETLIGNNSKKISSGQKQRIAIARLFYNAREILIFDEATNALDEKNETIIINNIFKMKNNKTIIMVSHNKKNLTMCDEIYEFNSSKMTKMK